MRPIIVTAEDIRIGIKNAKGWDNHKMGCCMIERSLKRIIRKGALVEVDFTSIAIRHGDARFDAALTQRIMSKVREHDAIASGKRSKLEPFTFSLDIPPELLRKP